MLRFTATSLLTFLSMCTMREQVCYNIKYWGRVHSPHAGCRGIVGVPLRLGQNFDCAFSELSDVRLCNFMPLMPLPFNIRFSNKHPHTPTNSNSPHNINSLFQGPSQSMTSRNNSVQRTFRVGFSHSVNLFGKSGNCQTNTGSL